MVLTRGSKYAAIDRILVVDVQQSFHLILAAMEVVAMGGAAAAAADGTVVSRQGTIAAAVNDAATAAV